MTLVDSRPQRITMLCAMYFAQGVPWGFMVTALASYLAEQGVSDGDLGNLTAIVLLPWTFKLVWGPLIDIFTIRSMGRRRPWIIGAELMMAVSLLGLLMMGDLSGNLRLLGWMFFIHNCFASLQDVATDALAVDILPPDEQGRTNGMMWGAKLIGKAVGATVMAMVIFNWSIQAAVLVQFVILIGIMFFPLLILERPGERRFPWSRPSGTKPATDPQASAALSNVRDPSQVIFDLYRGFTQVPTAVLFVFGVINLVGWGIIEVVTKPLYTQELGWLSVDYSKVAGAAVIVEMAGAFAGGWIADRFGRRKVMFTGFGLYGLMSIVFGSFPELWDQSWFATGFLFFNPCVLAMGAVGFLSMSMRISWTRAAATMFTVYMTVNNIGHVLGNKLVGTLREGYDLSYQETFWFAGIVIFLPLLLLIWIRPEEIDAARRLDPESA